MVKRLMCWTAIVCLAGCATSPLPPLPPPTAPSGLSEVVAQRQQLTNTTYTLGQDDVLRITVYDHPDLSQEVIVALDGAFTYPLLGKIQAVGLTVPELEQLLTRRLVDGYLVNPQVTVTVAQYRNRHVYILGAVRTPGVYPLPHNATLLELLSQAGGTMPEAGWEAIIMQTDETTKGSTTPTPAGQENHTTLPIDLDKLLAGQLPQPIRLASGDTIYVPLGGYFFISGEVTRPGRYRLERGMTIHKAITLAGGLSKFASESRMRVKRLVAGQAKEFQARLDDRLQAEDVLIVPESIF